MTYLPRRLRKPNSHPGRIVVTVYNDRLAFTDDRLSPDHHARPRTEVWAEPAKHHGRPEALVVWLAAVLALLCAIAWWAL